MVLHYLYYGTLLAMSLTVDKDDLRDYYMHVFPVELLVEWLSYSDTTLFPCREVSFAGLKFVKRFMSFSSAEALKSEILRVLPSKIDFGAIFSQPCDKKNFFAVVEEQREFIFDIDLSDYDNVRSCCHANTLCTNCWPFIVGAVRTLSDFFRCDLGFRKFFWVYSGRRGIHAWICDEAARRLTNEERHALVGYLSVYEGGSDPYSFGTNCDAELMRKGWLHPRQRFALEKHLIKCFETLYLNPENKNYIGTNRETRKSLESYLRRMASNYRNIDILLERLQSPYQTYQELQDIANEYNLGWVLEGLVLATTYPRLDMKVSTTRNHLLKAPFVIHPGTGRLCVPIPEEIFDTFDPIEDVPRLSDIIEALHKGRPLDLTEWYRPIQAVM